MKGIDRLAAGRLPARYHAGSPGLAGNADSRAAAVAARNRVEAPHGRGADRLRTAADEHTATCVRNRAGVGRTRAASHRRGAPRKRTVAVGHNRAGAHRTWDGGHSPAASDKRAAAHRPAEGRTAVPDRSRAAIHSRKAFHSRKVAGHHRMRAHHTRGLGHRRTAWAGKPASLRLPHKRGKFPPRSLLPRRRPRCKGGA
jgi:hypothetical protein